MFSIIVIEQKYESNGTMIIFIEKILLLC